MKYNAIYFFIGFFVVNLVYSDSVNLENKETRRITKIQEMPLFQPDNIKYRISLIAGTGDGVSISVNHRMMANKVINLSNGKEFFTINGKPQKEYDKLNSDIVFSPDGSSHFYIGKKDGENIIVYNGKEHTYEDGSIEDGAKLEMGGDFHSLHFLTYYFNNQGKTVMILDGKKLEEYDGIWDFKLSDDGKSYCYAFVNNSNGMSTVILNNKEFRKYKKSISNFIFSSNGNRLAYVVRVQEQNKMKLLYIIDGKEERYAYDEIEGTGNKYLTFSEDEKHYAYCGKRNNQWVVVKDGEEIASYDYKVKRLTFSPDGNHLAYAINKKDSDEMYVVLDGIRERNYYGIADEPGLLFSPDSKKLAYVAVISQSQNIGTVVENGVEGKYFGYIEKVKYSPDSRYLAYLAINDTKYNISRPETYPFLVINGQVIRQNEYFLGNYWFTLDSKNVLYLKKDFKNQKMYVGCNEDLGKAWDHVKITSGEIGALSKSYFDKEEYFYYTTAERNSRGEVKAYLVREKYVEK